MNTTTEPVINGHTRPEWDEDLPDYQREGRIVAHVNGEMLVKYPELGAHLLAALAEARKDDRLRIDGEGRIVEPLTQAELDAKVRSAQESWDRNRDAYLAARRGEQVRDWQRGIVDNWAKGEDLEPIDWTAVPA